ncbi:hypothetical protein M432DRAFT_141976 [Thermoascus aurantiacus ATCC 26904]
MTNQWEEIKQEIRTLCEEGKTLEEVMSHMKQKYNFHTSVRSYKTLLRILGHNGRRPKPRTSMVEASPTGQPNGLGLDSLESIRSTSTLSPSYSHDPAPSSNETRPASFNNDHTALGEVLPDIGLHLPDQRSFSVNEQDVRTILEHGASVIDLPQRQDKGRPESATTVAVQNDAETALEKPATQVSDSTEVKIDPFAKRCLYIALQDLHDRFTGDLVSLVTLDLLNSRFDINVDLSRAWREILIPQEVSKFVLACRYADYGISAISAGPIHAMISESLMKRDLDPLAKAAIKSYRKTPMASRDALVGILETMLNDELQLPDEIERARAKYSDLVKRALHFAKNGPDTELQHDLEPIAMPKSLEPSQEKIDKPETEEKDSGNEKGVKNNRSQRMNASLARAYALDHLDLYSDDDVDVHDAYSVSASSSPRDYTACSAEDCGYCGRCGY